MSIIIVTITIKRFTVYNCRYDMIGCGDFGRCIEAVAFCLSFTSVKHEFFVLSYYVLKTGRK